MSVTPFESLRLGPVTLPNRLALAPVKTALGKKDGLVSELHVAYYRRRALGGVGLVVVEPMYVDPAGREHPKQLGAHDDSVLPGLERLAEAVHREGSLVFAHLNHAGRAANPKVIGGLAEAPSAVPCPSTGATPTAMGKDRIVQVVQAYAEAAGRVVKAGFDGVELQLGLGYLPAQFMSTRTNDRGDEYGAAGEGRWRFVQELVAAVRGAVGDGAALVARISGDEKTPGGLGLKDALELAARLVEWGVHGIHVVTGSACDSPPWYYQVMNLPDGVNQDAAARIKSAVSIPVMVAGRLGEPSLIRDVLSRGMADIVALGRPLLADPDLPRKMRQGRDDEVIECGSCLQGCLARVKAGGPIGCIVNPWVGRLERVPAETRATGVKVVVVGGGPAGMEAALLARSEGHDVILLEKEADLGGLFSLAFATPGKQRMKRPHDSLKRAVLRSGVDVRTNTEATVDTIRALGPDIVFAATGSRPIVPGIPGMKEPLTAGEVIRGRDTGKRVLILGGGMVGIEMAELLAGRGKEVVVVELLEDVARDMEAVTRKLTMKRLESLPVTIYTRTRLVRMEEGEAIVEDASGDGEERSLGRFDSVLTAVGHRSNDTLVEELRKAGIRTVPIGDAVRPAQIFDATQSAFDAVMSLRD